VPQTIDLSGKAAIVTGAASGIGFAIAKELTACGASVLIADINDKAGQEAAASLPHARFHHVDLTVREECRGLVERAVAEWGGVDILVNNAGIQHAAPIEEFPEDKWEFMIKLMVIAPFLLTRYAIPHMYAKGWGRVINMASTQGLVGTMYKTAYAAAKHGLIGLTKATALEAGSKGVTVNAICPSFARTPLVEKQISTLMQLHNTTEQDIIERIFMGPAAIKRLLEPSEIANFAVFLCSDAAAGITGSAELIDCGWTAG
jgi:3-hydroxybutyrate dehydrogenase